MLCHITRLKESDRKFRFNKLSSHSMDFGAWIADDRHAIRRNDLIEQRFEMVPPCLLRFLPAMTNCYMDVVVAIFQCKYIHFPRACCMPNGFMNTVSIDNTGTQKGAARTNVPGIKIVDSYSRTQRCGVQCHCWCWCNFTIRPYLSNPNVHLRFGMQLVVG